MSLGSQVRGGGGLLLACSEIEGRSSILKVRG